ncbi:hypothetical protein [Sphingomonas sp. VNH70]
MIDNFSLGLTHLLLLVAAWRLLSRDDLDHEGPRRMLRRKPKDPPGA